MFNIGDRFGRLTVVAYLGSRAESSTATRRRSLYRLQCDCGRLAEALQNALHRGRTKSCGCLRSKGYATTTPTDSNA